VIGVFVLGLLMFSEKHEANAGLQEKTGEIVCDF